MMWLSAAFVAGILAALLAPLLWRLYSGHRYRTQTEPDRLIARAREVWQGKIPL